MIDSKNLLSDAELDKVAGGMTKEEAVGVLNSCINSKDGSFVSGGIKYTINLNGQKLTEELMSLIIEDIQRFESILAKNLGFYSNKDHGVLRCAGRFSEG